jgi:hypothetical protein
MAKLQHNRVPDQTLNPGSAPERSNPAGAEAHLSIRLWTPDVNTPDTIFWQSLSPAVCLTLDLVATSGGIPKPAAGKTLCADYSSLQQAVLAARRIQWALEGFADNETGKGSAATILVETAAESSIRRGAITVAFERAAPGQILLTASIWESLHDVPGLLLRNGPDGALGELVWRSSEITPAYAADEQAVLRMIHALGREDPSPPKVEIPVARPEPPVVKPSTASYAAPLAAVLPEPADPGDLIRPRIDRETQPAGGNRKWLILGGALAALFCVVALAWAVIHFRSAAAAEKQAAADRQQAAPEKPAPEQKATDKQAPAGNQAATVAQPPKERHTTVDGQTHGQTTAQTLPRQPLPPVSPVKGGPKKPPAVASGSCDFTPVDIERSLVRADNYMHAGKLSEAQAAFQTVAGCPTARERAMEGLQRVRQRMEAQNLSSTP